MDEACLVRGRQPTARLQVVLDDLPPRAPRHLSPRAQRHPGHVLHREEQRVLVLASLEHGDDVRVGEFAQRTGFSEDPLPLVGGCVRGLESLESHVPIELLVEALVDGTHPALADGVDDLIATDAWRRRGSAEQPGVYDRSLKVCVRPL